MIPGHAPLVTVRLSVLPLLLLMSVVFEKAVASPAPSDDWGPYYEGPQPCFSCATFGYLPLWSDLMHHYFPPRNFTDRCWQPDPAIGTVPCNSACFTLVETIDKDLFAAPHRAVMRGCMDRLLLFGLDDDVKDAFSAPLRPICRETDRGILRLAPLSTHTNLVLMCSCRGATCNADDMFPYSSTTPPRPVLSLLLLLLLFVFCSP